MDINAQNKEKYLEDLKNWLRELESAPLEEMGAFFRKRLPDYEARMTKFWGEDYKQFARARAAKRQAHFRPRLRHGSGARCALQFAHGYIRHRH